MSTTDALCDTVRTASAANETGEGKRHRLIATVAPPLYGAVRSRTIRDWIRRLTLRFEGGAMYSMTVREIYRRYHDLDVGLYTIGPCESGPYNFAPGTTVGRYCSIYYTVRTLGANDWPPMAMPAGAGGAAAPAGPPANDRLVIGNDVFIGHNAIILPGVVQIGDGAFIGAGAVVQKSVPPYAVVMGNPARVVKYRFSEKVIEELCESRWWEQPLHVLAKDRESFEVPLESTTTHSLTRDERTSAI